MAEAKGGISKEFRKWSRELKLAEDRDKDWVKDSKELWKKYRGEVKKANAYNLLWANTETLRPNLYNSIPKPDVRRRFRDADPLGKAVAETLERGLIYSIDNYSFDCCVRFDVLDALVDGRGVSRVRYVPSLQQVGGELSSEEEQEKSHEAFEGNTEELEYEQVICEHVNWQDLRHSYGRTWDEVTWVAFAHQLRKDDVKKMFGEDVAKAIKYDQPKDKENFNKQDELQNSELYLTSRFWEIWDKEDGKVFFFQSDYQGGLIYPLDNPNGKPPIDFKLFFPIAEPLKLIEDSGTLVPSPPYNLYKQQADEVDRISARINKLVNALKVRGAYDSTMSELSNIMTGEDNDLLPVANAAKWMTNGGLEKAIWWMPIEQAAKVIADLYKAREEAKRAVYELSGISDIMRGATDASETYGAQELKANFGSMRLKRMQHEVQRYIRDTIRLMAEVIGEKFQPQTLQKMTGLKFPDAQSKQIAQSQASAISAQGQPVPEQLQSVLMLPTWDEIKQVMQDDMAREYRVDVETDSTIQASMSEDMNALKEVITGLVQFWQGVGPGVQAGAIPIEAVKAISLTIARRAKMGNEVEDTLEKIKQPAPQPPQGAAQVDPMQAQIEQQKAAVEMERTKVDAAKVEADKQVALSKHAFDMENLRIEEQRLQTATLQAEVDRHKTTTSAQHEAEKMRVDQEKHALEQQSQVDMANEQTNQMVAELGQKIDTALAAQQQQGEQLGQMMLAMLQAIKSPRRVSLKRGPDGRAQEAVSMHVDGTMQ